MLNTKQSVGALLLVLAGLLWGFGFIAAAWALESFTAVQITLFRFLIAFVVSYGLLSLTAKTRSHLNFKLLPLAFWPGLWITLMLVFQTWGLQHTTPAKSAFITTLYVLWIPLIEAATKKTKVPPLIIFCCAIALLGTAIMVDFSWSYFNQGDFLAFICSWFGAIHVVSIDRVSKKIQHPFAFNALQSFWAFLLAGIFLIYEDASLPALVETSNLSLIGLLSLALGSTVIAFYLQIRAQKVLAPTLAGLLFLLESPFALIFSVYLIHEDLDLQKGLGAAIIVAACAMAILGENKNKQDKGLIKSQ